jgi:hypothetical protein
MAKTEARQSPAEKLARLQAGLIEQRATAVAASEALRAVIRGVAPIAFDESIAREQATYAQAQDALHGTATAPKVLDEIDKARLSVAQAINGHLAGKDFARADLARLEGEVAGVDSQIKQIDLMIRAELATVAQADAKSMKAEIIAEGRALLVKLLFLQGVEDTAGIDQLDPYGKQLDGLTPVACSVSLPFKTDEYHYLMQVGRHDVGTLYENRLDYIHSHTGGVWPESMAAIHTDIHFSK